MLDGKKKLLGSGNIREVFLVDYHGRKFVLKTLREDFVATALRTTKMHRWEAAALDAVSDTYDPQNETTFWNLLGLTENLEFCSGGTGEVMQYAIFFSLPMDAGFDVPGRLSLPGRAFRRTPCHWWGYCTEGLAAHGRRTSFRVFDMFRWILTALVEGLGIGFRVQA